MHYLYGKERRTQILYEIIELDSCFLVFNSNIIKIKTNKRVIRRS